MVCWDLPILTNYHCHISNVANTAASSTQKLYARCDSSGSLSTTCQSFNCTDSVLLGGLVVIFVLMPAAHSLRHSTQVVIYCIPLVIVVIQLCWRFKTKICSIITICQRMKSVVAAISRIQLKVLPQLNI